jgi:hypothetical protein
MKGKAINKTKLTKKLKQKDILKGRNESFPKTQSNTLRISDNTKLFLESNLNDSNSFKKLDRNDTDLGIYSKFYGNRLKEEKKFENLLKTLNKTVYSDLKNRKKIQLEKFEKQNKIVNDLEKSIKQNIDSLNNINQNNSLTYKKNNSLIYENISLKKMNNHNDKEINSTKNLIEKMNKQIDSFDKNTRASNLEKVKIQKELELNNKDIKEISKQISVLLIDIKSTKSAIFDYNVKIGKLRKELNRNLGIGDNLSSEVQYLINRFGKK